MYQAEIFVDGGRTFANQARLSAAGIPQIAVVHGSSTAGGAYLPGLSDYVVLVRGRSSIYLAGPPLVKAAIGEDATDEELGGAQMHAEVTGLGEYLAENDAHAHRASRARCSTSCPGTRVPPPPSVARHEPLFDREELLGVVPPTSANPTTCARSSPASSTARTSSSSRPATAPTRSAATPASTATRWA
jgi:geranyl-CoA carboxylase beta subunit